MLLFYTVLIDAPEERNVFEKIYYQYRKQMKKVIERYLDNPQDVEDALQNAFLGIARSVKTVPIHEEKVTRAYVLTVAKNAAIAMLPQKHQRSRQVEISFVQYPEEDDVFEKVAAAEDYEVLLRCIRQLDSTYRDVLLMVYVYGHDYKTAATALSRKPETVRKQLYRGRLLLRALWEKEGNV